jgi:enoyl-CoA hydratase
VRYQHIDLSCDGHVAELSLDNPGSRNAMTDAMAQEFRVAIKELNNRDDVRVLIVHGAGSAFSAGGDWDMLEKRAAENPESNRRAMRLFYDRFLAIRRLRVPSIAAVNGAAIGAGACLAVACDLRIAAASAKFGFTFVRIGLHPGMGATHLLPRLVGPGVAAELLLTGRTIDAEEALRIGLVNEVVDDALAAARAKAAAIATAAPVAVQQTKSSLRGAFNRTLDDSLEAEARAQAVDYGTEDLIAGISAVRTNRTPTFRGR